MTDRFEFQKYARWPFNDSSKKAIWISIVSVIISLVLHRVMSL